MSSVEVVTELPRLAVGVYLKDQTENLLAEDGCVTVYEGEQVQLVIELANRESRLDVECLKFIIAEEAQADAERMALRSKWTGCFSSEFERSTLLWSDGVTLLANDDDDTDLELPGIKVGERASFVLTLPGSKLISNLGIHLTYTAKGHSHWRYESLLLRFECHRSLYVSLHPFCYDVSEFCEKLLVYLEVEHLRPQDSFVFEIVKAKGTGSSTTIVRSPLGNSPLGNSPLGNSPLGNSPLGNSPLGNSPLGERGDVVVRYEIPTEGQLTKVPLCVPRSWINSRDPIQSLWQRIIKTYRFQWTCGSKKGTAIVTPIQSGGDMGTSAAFLSSAGTVGPSGPQLLRSASSFRRALTDISPIPESCIAQLQVILYDANKKPRGPPTTLNKNHHDLPYSPHYLILLLLHDAEQAGHPPRPESTQRPDFQRPDFQRPDFQRPDFQRPDFQRPDFQRPDFQRPDFQRSEVDSLVESGTPPNPALAGHTRKRSAQTAKGKVSYSPNHRVVGNNQFTTHLAAAENIDERELDTKDQADALSTSSERTAEVVRTSLFINEGCGGFQSGNFQTGSSQAQSCFTFCGLVHVVNTRKLGSKPTVVHKALICRLREDQLSTAQVSFHAELGSGVTIGHSPITLNLQPKSN